MIISKGKLVASDSPEGLQKLMSGAPELEIIVKGDADKIHTVLENVEGVASVTDVNAEEAADKMTVNEQNIDCRQYKIVADGDKDLRESIFYACADNRLPIMGMTYNSKSLEDIFLELTVNKEEEE
jgi:ABC-2 type transport system ATP-binding protein